MAYVALDGIQFVFAIFSPRFSETFIIIIIELIQFHIRPRFRRRTSLRDVHVQMQQQQHASSPISVLKRYIFFFFWTKFNNVSPGRTQSPSLFVYIVNAHTCKRYTLTHAHTHTFGDRTPTEPVFYVFFAGSRAPRCSSRFAIYVLQVHTHNTRISTPR